MARDDLVRRLAEVQEGIEAATVMQDFRSIGQLARERDRLQRELAEDATEESTDEVGDRLAVLEGELREVADE